MKRDRPIPVVGTGEEPRTFTEYRITMRTNPEADFVYRSFTNSMSQDRDQIERFLRGAKRTADRTGNSVIEFRLESRVVTLAATDWTIL